MLSLGMGILVFLVYSSTALAQTTSRYTKEECRRCHAKRVIDIAVAGGGHSSVPCLDCHAGHPPEVPKAIAPCSNCHLKRKNEHFGATGCLTCHMNPHRPLDMSFKGAKTDDCLPCHFLQGSQLSENLSKHSALECSTCHDVHRKFPQCTQCHKPHSGKIVGNCRLCHNNAHMPKLAAFPDAVPSNDCSSCHKKAADLISATTSRHKSFACARCHQGKHNMIPACQDCHGTPHPEAFMVKFPECGDCHYIAHDLNNWPATASSN